MRELAVIGDTGGAEFRALVAGQGSLRPCASCPSSRLNYRSRSSGFGRDQNDGTGRAFVDQGVLNQDPRPERKCGSPAIRASPIAGFRGSNRAVRG
jgi:hypothetical protein